MRRRVHRRRARPDRRRAPGGLPHLGERRAAPGAARRLSDAGPLRVLVSLHPSSYARDISQYVGDPHASCPDAAHREDRRMGQRGILGSSASTSTAGAAARAAAVPRRGSRACSAGARPAARSPRRARARARGAATSGWRSCRRLADAARRGEPVNGYQVIQQIAERSNGAWRPSPGSVYPTIQQLAGRGPRRDRRRARPQDAAADRRRRGYVAEHADELAAVWAPFERAQQRASTGAGRPTSRPRSARS